MDDKHRTAISKFLSYVLRHEPGAVGITLDAAGWVEVDVLLDASARHGRHLTRAELDDVVATSPKQRFALSEDGQRIRASQGHTTAVDLGYEPAEPPDVPRHQDQERRCSKRSTSPSTTPTTRTGPSKRHRSSKN